MKLLFPYLARWNSANWSRYHQLLSTLADRGHEVVVVQPPARQGTAETNYIEMPAAVASRVKLVEASMPLGFWNTRWPLDKLVKKGSYSLRLLQVVGRELRRHGSDVLLLYNLPLFPLLRAEGVFTVFDIADDLPAMLAHEAGALGPGAAWLARRLQRWMVAQADCVTVSSATLGQLVAPQAHVVTNGANLPLIAQADGAAYRARYPGPLAGFVGAFEYFVDFELVLAAAAQLPEVTFLLAGAGRAWAGVQQAVQTRGLANVHLPGPLPYREALNAMAAMDICLLPFAPGPVSDTSSPLKLFEYAALGKPIVSTSQAEFHRLGGEFIKFADTGPTWAAAIRALLADPTERAWRGAAGARAISHRYHWGRLADDFTAAVQASPRYRA